MPHQPELIPTESSPEQVARNAEREEYLERLRQKLKDPAFRAIEGFPIAEDEAILALSDPPYYTACPNPFLPEIIEQWQKERSEFRVQSSAFKVQGSKFRVQSSESKAETVNPEPRTENPKLGTENPEPGTENSELETYHREPFAADVSEGKNDPIYRAHSYHTKVPHKAIMRYILHYTEPGDIVFDGFCGTGMTGVAAQLCDDKKTVESLGFHVTDDGTCIPLSSSEFRVQSSELKAKTENPEPGTKNPESRTLNPELKTRNYPKLGPRKAVLCDLSPAATFIAYNYNTPVDVKAFKKEAKRILREVEEECGWMYETLHTDGKTKGWVNWTIWSDVFLCPECGTEMVFWDMTVDEAAKKIHNNWPCPGCSVSLAKSPTKKSGSMRVERAWQTVYDSFLGRTVHQLKQSPVLINYSVGKNRYEKKPDADDLSLLQEIEQSNIPYWFPDSRMPDGDEARRNDRIGITNIHQFYTKRNLRTFSTFWEASSKSIFRVALLGGLSVGLKMARFRVPLWFNKTSGPMKGLTSGTLYVPSLSGEQNWLNIFGSRMAAVRRQLTAMNSTNQLRCTAINTGSSTDIHLPENAVDYIFTDPPFGGNLMYSELNFISEGWLQVFTNNAPEAITNNAQQKGIPEYQRLMERCFSECQRILKPGRWLTVEFHNSQNRVWNAIQEAILRAGFMIADVRTLDKKQGSFKQVTTSAATKQDLIISAYKPRAEFEQQFLSAGGRETGAWEFIRQHLEKLPPPDEKNGIIEVASERQSYLLYDRMVAFHIQRGFSVPLSAAEFYAGLRQKFPERDGMYFLPPQAAEYDRRRLTVERVEQLALFVNDEKSAIQWLQRELDSDTGSGPQTYQDLQPKFLRELHQARHEQLPELRDILEENFLQDDDERWFLPDPGKQEHLEQLRERSLLREFQEYAGGKGRLKVFRTEAVRAGFKRAWADKQYRLIVQVAERLPNSVLQEDPGLLMYYDNALMRAEQEPRQLGF